MAIVETYKGLITELKDNEVFVFGSNLNGFHGAGSAGYASFGESGNVWHKYDYANKPKGWKGKWNEKGVGEGPQMGVEGKSFAIPTVTKAGAKRSLTLDQIQENVEKFYSFARIRPNLTFYVAQKTSGNLNGYSGEEMASVFRGDIPDNVVFDEDFAALISGV